jgi:hypothetical protein
VRFFFLSSLRSLTMERDCRKGFQFYTDLTELSVKLGSATRSFVSKRTSEREALVEKLESEKRLSAVAATSPPPPLAAKPPLLPPLSFKPYNMDGVFDALKLGRESPQQTQQQWENNGGILSSPPPPPAPKRNSCPTVSSPAPGPSPYTQFPTHKPTLSLPTSSPPRSSSFLPPLSPSFSGISQPGQGSYANLGGFLGTGRIRPPAGQDVPPQPLSGRGALSPPLGQSVLPSRLPTMAELERRQSPFPAAALRFQSPPPPSQQPQQQQQQEEYEQRPHLLYQFNRFVGHTPQDVRNRHNSEVSLVTKASDETRPRVRRLQGDGRTVGLRTAAALAVHGRKHTALAPYREPC